MTKEDWIEELEMTAHPEGGYFKETYRSQNEFVPEGFDGKRNYSTSICFLLGKAEVSHFHKINSDELWNYHYGAPCRVHMLHQDGRYEWVEIGPDVGKGHRLQFVVPKGVVFASQSMGDYSLVGCVVSPGFDFRDFHLYTTKELVGLFPNAKEIIKKFTKENYQK